MKGYGKEFNASFLGPEASLNSCCCRKMFYCRSSIHVTFPVDCELTFHKNEELPPVVCPLTGIRMRRPAPGRHKNVKRLPKIGHPPNPIVCSHLAGGEGEGYQ